jgi:hypothetical protein
LVVIALLFQMPATSKPIDASLKEKLLQMDFSGTFFIMTSIICYLLAMEWGGVVKPWNSGAMIALLVLFPLLIFGFVVNEWWQGEKAQITIKVLKDRTMVVSCIFAFL